MPGGAREGESNRAWTPHNNGAHSMGSVEVATAVANKLIEGGAAEKNKGKTLFVCPTIRGPMEQAGRRVRECL